ncbi:MAG: hypothetical protein R3C56_01280 [Pirellulaceae bacterium]
MRTGQDVQCREGNRGEATRHRTLADQHLRNCHIAKRSSGEFSMALPKPHGRCYWSDGRVPGSARSSRLVDVIESGDMPRGRQGFRRAIGSPKKLDR